VVKDLGCPVAAARVFEGTGLALPIHQVVRDEHLVALRVGGGVKVVLPVRAQDKRIGHLALGQQRVAVGLGRGLGPGTSLGRSDRGAGCQRSKNQEGYLGFHARGRIDEDAPLGKPFDKRPRCFCRIRAVLEVVSSPSCNCREFVTVDLRSSSRHLHAMQNNGPLKEFLEGRMPAALEMLRQMVEINSFTGNRRG